MTGVQTCGSSDLYNIHHYPNSIEVVNFLNRGILVDAKVLNDNSVEHDCLGIIKGNFVKKYKKGTSVKLLVQPEDLEHDDKSNLKLEVVDKKFRGTNFIYILKTQNNDLSSNLYQIRCIFFFIIFIEKHFLIKV